MVVTFTLKDILDRACQKEIVSQLFYKDLAQRMKKEEVSNAFKELAQQEFEHQNLIRKELEGIKKELKELREELKK